MQLAIPPGSESKARTFWLDLLGFEEVAKPEELRERGGLWVRSGGVEIHLGVEEVVRPSRKAHPALVVADLDALIAELESAGYSCSPDTDIDGHRRVHTEDPFGNRIELMMPTYPAASSGVVTTSSGGPTQ